MLVHKLHFQEDNFPELLCRKNLTKEDLEKFREAPKKDYYTLSEKIMQIFFVQTSPFWNPIHYCSYWSKFFYITEDKEIEVVFTYSVKWVETQTPFKRQMDNYFKILILTSVFGNPFGVLLYKYLCNSLSSDWIIKSSLDNNQVLQQDSGMISWGYEITWTNRSMSNIYIHRRCLK